MKLQQQVVSLDLAKRLKELNVIQESLYRHVCFLDYGNGQKIWSPAGWYLVPKNHVMFDRSTIDEEWCSAFTVAELGEMFPPMITRNGQTYSLVLPCPDGMKETSKCGGYRNENPDETDLIFNSWQDTEADARAKMLIYLLENNLIAL